MEMRCGYVFWCGYWHQRFYFTVTEKEILHISDRVSPTERMREQWIREKNCICFQVPQQRIIVHILSRRNNAVACKDIGFIRYWCRDAIWKLIKKAATLSDIEYRNAKNLKILEKSFNNENDNLLLANCGFKVEFQQLWWWSTLTINLALGKDMNKHPLCCEELLIPTCYHAERA